MTHTERDKLYTETARNYAGKWNVDDEHIIQIIKSVMYHRDEIYKGGGFVEAVVNNNLSDAVGRADSTCLKYLNVIVAAKRNCYVN